MSRRGFIAAGLAAVVAASCEPGQRSATVRTTTTDLADRVIDLRSPDSSPPNATYLTPQDELFLIDTVGSAYPRLDRDAWSLKIHGMVDNEIEVNYADILSMPQVENVVTLACVSNEVGGELVGNARWGGVLLADVLRRAGVQAGAQQLVSTSADGWTCGTPVDAVLDGRPAMLATHVNGEELRGEHGFPVRMIVPGLFGFVSATKWVTEIKATTWDAFTPYWLERGWAREAPIVSSSRIDIPRNGQSVAAGKVTVGGFAWAPRDGVARVELQIDKEPWVDCEIIESTTGDAWVQWSVRVTIDKGDHVLTVRCADTRGVVQVADVRDVIPAGATGLHSIDVIAT
jgi:DMSO/TMAO reductase YedYZ molybdopterin-dependent catalytic subunit